MLNLEKPPRQRAKHRERPCKVFLLRKSVCCALRSKISDRVHCPEDGPRGSRRSTSKFFLDASQKPPATFRCLHTISRQSSRYEVQCFPTGRHMLRSLAQDLLVGVVRQAS